MIITHLHYIMLWLASNVLGFYTHRPASFPYNSHTERAKVLTAGIPKIALNFFAATSCNVMSQGAI